jgi:hypothetical protein
MNRQRKLIEQLLKSWSQDHCHNFIVADYDLTEEAMNKTQSHFTWIIREGHANIDLLGLADRLEMFLHSQKQKRNPDGMICQKCKNFQPFAEGNQTDGSLICYSCIKNPYI